MSERIFAKTHGVERREDISGKLGEGAIFKIYFYDKEHTRAYARLSTYFLTDVVNYQEMATWFVQTRLKELPPDVASQIHLKFRDVKFTDGSVHHKVIIHTSRIPSQNYSLFGALIEELGDDIRALVFTQIYAGYTPSRVIQGNGPELRLRVEPLPA